MLEWRIGRLVAILQGEKRCKEIFSNGNTECRSHRFAFTLQHTDNPLKTFPKVSKQQGRFND